MENVSLFVVLANEVKKLKEEIELLKSKKKGDREVEKIDSIIEDWINDNPSEIRSAIDLESEIEDGIREFFRNI